MNPATATVTWKSLLSIRLVMGRSLPRQLALRRCDPPEVDAVAKRNLTEMATPLKRNSSKHKSREPPHLSVLKRAFISADRQPAAPRSSLCPWRRPQNAYGYRGRSGSPAALGPHWSGLIRHHHPDLRPGLGSGRRRCRKNGCGSSLPSVHSRDVVIGVAGRKAQNEEGERRNRQDLVHHFLLP